MNSLNEFCVEFRFALRTTTTTTIPEIHFGKLFWMRLIWPKNIIRTQSNKRFKQNESSLLLLAKRHRLRSINEVRIFIFDSFSKTQLIPNLLHPSIFYPILNQPKQPKSIWLLHSILDKIKLFYLNKFFVNLFLRLVLQKNTTNWVKKLEMKKVEKRKKTRNITEAIWFWFSQIFDRSRKKLRSEVL